MEVAIAHIPDAKSHRHETTVVYYPQLGSSNAQDAGRDAAYIAHQTGHTTIAVNRPGTGFFPSKKAARSIRENYQEAMKWSTDEVSRLIGKLGLTDTKVVLAGRSSGGLAALTAATLDILPVSGVYAAEPVGQFATDPDAGLRSWREYKAEEGRRVADMTNERLVRPEPTDTQGLARLSRLASIPFLAYTDIQNNKALWATPVAQTMAAQVAERPIAMTIDFADYSLVATPETVVQEAARLQKIRGDSDVPLSVTTVPDTVHSSFDKRSFFLERLQPTISYAVQIALEQQ